MDTAITTVTAIEVGSWLSAGVAGTETPSPTSTEWLCCVALPSPSQSTGCANGPTTAARRSRDSSV